MAGWIESGVIAWMEKKQYEDEIALGYFRGIGPAGMAEGLITQHRPPFARGDVAPGEWGVVVHHMHNPSRDGFDPVDHRTLCPAGAELVVFESHPCVGRAHGPKAYHYRDGQVSSRIDYENPEYVGEYGPNELVSVITAAGPDHENPSHEQHLTRLICGHSEAASAGPRHPHSGPRPHSLLLPAACHTALIGSSVPDRTGESGERQRRAANSASIRSDREPQIGRRTSPMSLSAGPRRAAPAR
ncbi:hypothetical protein [Streptomyces griseolus]|uniref:hypothetical protein n=1 Tax=Streptomyces griseolus TaxID=1909 RepID=UPI002242FD01|nr:hypothetical protein [Streptomyces griseolus]